MLHYALDSIEDVRFWNVVDELDRELETNKEKYFKHDFISAYQTLKSSDADTRPQEYIDSVRNVLRAYYDDERKGYNDEGWALWQRRDSIAKGVRPFRVWCYTEHPMLWAYYVVLTAIQTLNQANVFANFGPAPHEQMLSLKDIASFLNVTPVYLSKIRKEITFGKEK